MAEPEVYVYLAFGDNPFAESPTWEDVTEYVQAFNPSYGRSAEIGSVEAGIMTLVLDNTDGRFTPNRVASPYYPNITPRVPVKVEAVHDSITYPLFRGHVERWPATTEAGITNMSVTCVDPLALFANLKLENPWTYYARRPEYQLRELWTMGEDAEAQPGLIDPTNTLTPVQSITTGPVFALSGTRPEWQTKAEDILPNGAGLGSVAVTGHEWATIGGKRVDPSVAFTTKSNLTFDTSLSGSEWSVSLFWKFDGQALYEGDYPENGLDLSVFRIMQQGEPKPWIEVRHLAAYGDRDWTTYYLRYFDNTGTAHEFGPYWVLPRGWANNPSGADLITLMWDADWGLTLQINGINSWEVSYQDNRLPYDPANPDDDDDEVSLWEGNLIQDRVMHNMRIEVGPWLSPDPVAALYGDTESVYGYNFRAAMLGVWDREFQVGYRDVGTGFEGDLIDPPPQEGMPSQTIPERLGYLLDQLGWPESRRDLDTTDDGSLMRFLAWESKPDALPELRAPVLDTHGLLYAAPDGRVTYESRHARVNPTVDYVLDASAGTGVESPLNFDMSEDDITNVVDVDNAYGVKTQVRNDASVAVYGETGTSRSTRLVSDDEAIQSGYYVVNRNGDAQLRVDGVTLNPAAHAEGVLWPTVLALRLSDVIELAGLPDGSPDEGLTFFVEKITHTVERSGERLLWLTDLEVSPAANRAGWVLGDPVHGVLGSTTVLHY